MGGTRNLGLFSQQKKPQTKQIQPEEWETAERAFNKDPALIRLSKNNIPIEHDFIRLKKDIYTIGEDIGAGSKGIVSLAFNKNNENYVIKLTELDEITFPDISLETQEEFGGIEEFVDYLKKNPQQAFSSEEIILKQKGWLINSGLTWAENPEEVELAIVMPNLGISLWKQLNNQNEKSVDLLKIAAQCIEQVEELHMGRTPLDRRFIHGDISISNFLIDINKNIHLIDFGSSVEITEDAEATYTLPPSIDVRYTNVPPEYKQRICSIKSDVYRLSEVLLQLLPKDMDKNSELNKLITQMRVQNADERPTLSTVKKAFSEELDKHLGISPRHT